MNRPVFGQSNFLQRTSLRVENNTLVLVTPYDVPFLDAFRAAIPATDRKWDKAKKVWLVAPQHAKAIQRLVLDCLQENIAIPTLTVSNKTESRVLELRYMGRVKQREGADDRSAFGWDGKDWNIILPESVLREWFDAPAKPDEAPTLYATLLVKRDSTDEEIKSSYRRLVKQWHPDKCKEPDAAEQFRIIQHAYEILSNKRARYDVGLQMELGARQPKRDYSVSAYPSHGYQSPLRSGYLYAEGIDQLGRFIVSKILQWQDITDPQGRTLVSSWDISTERVVEQWV